MNKEEILKKSRMENKNQDIYEKEVVKEGRNMGAFAAVILATVFFILRILLGQGMDCGLYAVTFSVFAAEFIVKAVRLKRKHEIIVAACYTAAVLLFSAGYIYQLLTAPAVL